MEGEEPAVKAGSSFCPGTMTAIMKRSDPDLLYNAFSFVVFREVDMSLKKMFVKTMLSAMLGVSLLAGVATPARGDDKCSRDIHKAEENLEKAVRKHGEHSRQAEQRRQELEAVRERCRARDHDHDGPDHH